MVAVADLAVELDERDPVLADDVGRALDEAHGSRWSPVSSVVLLGGRVSVSAAGARHRPCRRAAVSTGASHSSVELVVEPGHGDRHALHLERRDVVAHEAAA